MKKVILLTTITLALHFSLHAQIGKDSWMLGGSIGVSSNAYNYGTFTQYTFAPRAGYFVIDRLAAGRLPDVQNNHRVAGVPRR